MTIHILSHFSTTGLKSGSPTGSRSTTTMTLPSGNSRVLLLMGVYGNPSGASAPMSGNTTPTFGNVAMSVITRPTGGSNVFQSMNWILPISDGSSGDYALVQVKQAANDNYESVGMFLSNVSSVYSSVVSTNLSTGPMGIVGDLVPDVPANDMVIGFVTNASGATTSHTKLGTGYEIYSNITVGGGAVGGLYQPTMSVVSVQGESSVSLQWQLNGDAQRWRLHGLILYDWDTSQYTLAGTVTSSATTSSAASSVLTLVLAKETSLKQGIVVCVSSHDAPGTGVLPIVKVDGVTAALLNRNDVVSGPANPTSIRNTIWYVNTASGPANSIVTVSNNYQCGVVGMVVVGVDQTTPSSSSSNNANQFSSGPLTSVVSASNETQLVIGFGSISFDQTLTAGSGQSSIATVEWGPGSSTSALCCIVSTENPATVPNTSMQETATGNGRWRYSTVVLNLDGTWPAPSQGTGAAYFVRRRLHTFDW